MKTPIYDWTPSEAILLYETIEALLNQFKRNYAERERKKRAELLKRRKQTP